MINLTGDGCHQRSLDRVRVVRVAVGGEEFRDRTVQGKLPESHRRIRSRSTSGWILIGFCFYFTQLFSYILHGIQNYLLCPMHISTNRNRARSFDRITFFRNSSVVLSKFVSKEKFCSFEYRRRLNVLSKVVLLKYSKERNSNKKMEKRSQTLSLLD